MQNIDDDFHIEKNERGEDVYVFDPYNPLNKVISQNDIQEILSKFGVDVPIHNIKLYQRAFIHRSYIQRPSLENAENNVIIAKRPDNCLELFQKSNERLEFVGDGVLECIAKYYLYYRFPLENEGFMTEKKIAIVKNESIGKLAMDLGLHKWVILSKHAELKQTRTNLKKLGCLFEAFIGAMFLDFNKIDIHDEGGWFRNMFLTGPGFQMVQVFVTNIFEQLINWTHLIKNDDNYKNILQVIIQKEFKVTPHYLEMNSYNGETGYHMGVFLCYGQPIHNASLTSAISCTQFRSFREIHEYVSVNSKILLFLGDGHHLTKKKAEQSACENAIKSLGAFA
jgi:dsRNA-specific ribonuclease